MDRDMGYVLGRDLGRATSADAHWWDLDAGAAAGWIVLGSAAAVVGAVGGLLARRFRVVRR